MKTISITYTIKFEVDFAPEYVFNKYKECFNAKTGRRIRQVYNNGSIGYSIRGKFYSLKKLKPYLRKPVEIDVPF